MTELTGSVGTGGANAPHDVALVQAMLQAINNREGRRYYDSNYNGTMGPETNDAIVAFQNEYDLFDIDFGHVTSGGETWRRMVEGMPEANGTRIEMRILRGARIVYLTVSKGQFDAGIERLKAGTFKEGGFRDRVKRLMEDMYKEYGLSLTVPDDGHYRSFEQQAKLYNVGRRTNDDVSATQSGSGESYHNFGLAADVPFNAMKLVLPDGTVVLDLDINLKKLKSLDPGEYKMLWTAHDTIAGRHNLKKIGTADRAHVQNESGKPMARALVVLLNKVGKMEWNAPYSSEGSPAPINYHCDLGGIKLVEVGTADDVWRLSTKVYNGSIAEAYGGPPSYASNHPDVSDVRRWLKEDFQLAEKHWRDWGPEI